MKDHYPFGMEMMGRGYQATGPACKFGFNGQLRSDEVYGKGNLNTALFWEYDTRVGRRWNIDPKPLISISNYAAFINNPVLNDDLLGDIVNINNKRAQEIHDSKYKKDKEYAKVFDQLNQNTEAVFNVGNPNENVGTAGTVLPRGKSDGQSSFEVIWGKPNEANGGGDDMVLMEELFHCKQILDSKEWEEKREMPNFTISMEVAAKRWAAKHARFEVEYLMPGGQGFRAPTTMGIMTGSEEHNRHIDAHTWLKTKTQMTIWKPTGVRDEVVQEVDHDPDYPNFQP